MPSWLPPPATIETSRRASGARRERHRKTPMTYERKIRFSLSIDEKFSDDDVDPSPSLPPMPAVETSGETVSEETRPLPIAKCRPALSLVRKAG